MMSSCNDVIIDIGCGGGNICGSGGWGDGEGRGRGSVDNNDSNTSI